MKAFRIAMVDINLEGEYEDYCTLYTNEEKTKDICFEKALNLNNCGYSFKKYELHPWKTAKICHQRTTLKIVYRCVDKKGKVQYIGYTTYKIK